MLPASVAMQTVSKSYVDTQIASALDGASADGGRLPYVAKAGDTMTGPLALAGDPTSAAAGGEQALCGHGGWRGARAG